MQALRASEALLDVNINNLTDTLAAHLSTVTATIDSAQSQQVAAIEQEVDRALANENIVATQATTTNNNTINKT